MLARIMFLCSVPLFLYGCGQTNVPPAIHVPSVGEVSSITVQGSSQGSSKTPITIPGTSAVVQTVVSDLKNSKQIGYEKEIQLGTQPISVADLHLKSGQDVTIQTAVDCQVRVNGNQGETVCKNLPGYVDFISGGKLPIRLQSQPLYHWLIQRAKVTSTSG